MMEDTLLVGTSVCHDDVTRMCGSDVVAAQPIKRPKCLNQEDLDKMVAPVSSCPRGTVDRGFRIYLALFRILY